jgi:glycine hydroxymethyltransferase
MSTLNDVQPGFFTRTLADADPAVFAGVSPSWSASRPRSS